MVDRLCRFQVFGERNTGTNYMESLLSENIEGMEFLLGRTKFGWKHGDLGQSWKKFDESDKLNWLEPESLCATHDTLFIVMWREVFSWLLAMHRMPHHAPAMVNVDFSTFLRNPWRSYYGNAGDDLSVDAEIRAKLMARPGALFESETDVLTLRRNKVRVHSSFARRVPNVAYVNLETLQAQPEAVLRLLASVYNLPLKPGFRNITHAKHSDQAYQPPLCSRLAVKDVVHIVRNVDWNMEIELGYRRPSYWQALRAYAKAPQLELIIAGNQDNENLPIRCIRRGLECRWNPSSFTPHRRDVGGTPSLEPLEQNIFAQR